jgi:hypothetical protein
MKTEIGHWESDTVSGVNHCGVVGYTVDMVFAIQFPLIMSLKLGKPIKMNIGRRST